MKNNRVIPEMVELTGGEFTLETDTATSDRYGRQADTLELQDTPKSKGYIRW